MLTMITKQQIQKAEETSAKIPLLKEVSRSLPELSMKKELVAPPQEVFSLLTASAKDEIKTIRKTKKNCSQEESKIEELKLIAAKATQDKSKLEAESKLALAVESNFFQNEVRKQTDLLNQTNSEADRRRAPFNKIKSLGKQLRDEAKKQLGDFIAKFPEAQLIDLNCLNYFKLDNGLPALTLFSVEYPLSRYHISGNPQVKLNPGYIEYGRHTFYRSTDLIKNISDELAEALGKSICIATGVGYGDDRGRNLFKRDFPEEIGSEKTLAYADSISLITDFASLCGAIPPEARKIIEHAKKSKEFESLLLLAEVREWQVEYEDLNGIPKIQGISKPKARTEDPLIIGVKKIWNRNFPFLLGYFDTTPLEKLLKDEFCVKP